MSQYPNLIGQRFGKLVVIERAENNSRGQRQWLCQCDCGGTRIVNTNYLRSGRTTDCGCKKSPDLTGKVFGRLTVLGPSDKRGSRGARTTRMWECRCSCGEITYKATDTLTNPEQSMCQKCAASYAAASARANAGFVEGTQLSKLRMDDNPVDTITGVRGVYYDSRKKLYQARIIFRRKKYYLGGFTNLEDAVKARKRAEEEIFGTFLDSLSKDCMKDVKRRTPHGVSFFSLLELYSTPTTSSTLVNPLVSSNTAASIMASTISASKAMPLLFRKAMMWAFLCPVCITPLSRLKTTGFFLLYLAYGVGKWYNI